MTKNDVARRCTIQYEVNAIADMGRDHGDDPRADLEQMAKHWLAFPEVSVGERSVLIRIAAYAQRLVEDIDREAAR